MSRFCSGWPESRTWQALLKNSSGTSGSLEAALREILLALSKLLALLPTSYNMITYQYELGTQSWFSLLLFLASRSGKDSFLFSSDFCSLLVPPPFEPNFEENGIQWKRPRQMWTAQVLHFLCQSIVHIEKNTVPHTRNLCEKCHCACNCGVRGASSLWLFSCFCIQGFQL